MKKQYEEVLLNEVDKIKKDNIVSNESKWASLKKLDEDTNWKERTEVSYCHLLNDFKTEN